MSNDRIQDYTITKELTNEHSGFAKWGFAEKNGEKFFIKEFLSPIYPDEHSPISQEQKQKKIDECFEWVNKKTELYKAICEAANGNIIVPRDFFREGSHYYLVTDKVDTCGLSIPEIAALDMEIKIIILKVFSHCLNQLGKQGVIHNDLKPENLLIKETVPGMYTVKLIDFDSGCLESRLPSQDTIQCDPTYMAPEVFLYMIEKNDIVTPKADVFSAGLIFHQYLCGKLPDVSTEYDYIYEAVLDDSDVIIDRSIPPRLASIIKMMLVKDPAERITSAYVYQLMLLTTQQSLLKGGSASGKPVYKNNTLHPASDEEW